MEIRFKRMGDMAEYKFFAKVYDRMMDNIPYEEWEQYILQLFYRYGVSPCSKITELGCGTGVMTRLLADDGFFMTGIDLSEEMLEVARKKDANNRSLQALRKSNHMDEQTEDEKTSGIVYVNSDMRNFHVEDKQDAVVSICDSMNYLLTEEALYETMASVHHNLKENGVFIFDLKTEYFFRKELDGERFKENMGDFSYVWKNRYDENKHIHEYRLLFERIEFGKVVKETEVHRQRTFSAGDIKEAALNAGFRHGAAYDAFTFEKPKKRSERIYIVLKKE